MHFQIEKKRRDVALLNEPPAEIEQFEWRLVAATGTLCRSPEPYQSISLARGAIAQFKRSASGARFAKVMEPQDA